MVVAFQPGLHADQIMLVHQEYDVLGPVDLVFKEEVDKTKMTKTNLLKRKVQTQMSYITGILASMQTKSIALILLPSSKDLQYLFC